MQKIIAGCLQFSIARGEVEENLATVEKALPWFAEKGCRLLVLPEMWTCGFDYRRLHTMALKTGTVVTTLQEWSRRHQMVMVGSLPEAAQGIVFNTAYVIDADGKIAGSYRKMHLFSPNGEDIHFGRGTRPLVCTTDAGRLGVIICYDLRFPELARLLALDGAEILCISALWPQPRIDHWGLLLRARAIENQLFVIGCNGCGKDGKLIYGGKSALISPRGQSLAEADAGSARLITMLDPMEMEEFRRQIPCFADRLPEAYESRNQQGHLMD